MSEPFESMQVRELRDMVEKIGGAGSARKLLTGKMVVKKWFPDFKVFTQIRLGGEPADAFGIRRMLGNQNVVLTLNGDELISSPYFEVSKSDYVVDLIATSVNELGIAEHEIESCRSVWEVAKHFGLDPCPLEVGPRLCLTRIGQNITQDLIIASDISHDKTFLLTKNGRPNGGLMLDVEWIKDRTLGGPKIRRDAKLLFIRSPKLVLKLALAE